MQTLHQTHAHVALPAESASPRFVKPPVLEAPPVVVECVQSAPVVEYVEPAPAVTYAHACPVVVLSRT